MSRFALKPNGRLDPEHILSVLAVHALPGMDTQDAAARSHTRPIALGSGHRLVTLGFAPEEVIVDCPGSDAAEREELGSKITDWLDLNTDLIPIQELLGTDPVLGPLVSHRPWLRLTGYLDGFEAACTTVLGQQVSLAAARTFGSRLLLAFGDPGPGGLLMYPTAKRLARTEPEAIRAAVGLTTARARTLHSVAQAFTARPPGTGRNFPLSRAELLALPGVGPWTADYLQTRAMGDKDGFTAGDLVLRRSLGGITARVARERSLAWSPYRAYALVHLWAADATGAQTRPGVAERPGGVSPDGPFVIHSAGAWRRPGGKPRSGGQFS